jgi:hypothetical protein
MLTRCSLLGLVWLMCASAAAGDLAEVDERLSAPGISVMDVELNLTIGRYDISACEPADSLLGIVTGRYDRSRFDYTLDLHESHDRADLYFATETIGHHLSDWKDVDNDFEFSFSPDVQLRLNMDIGASETHFDFSDLSISEMDLNVGAADAEVSFPTLNGTEMRYLTIDAGASKLRVYDLGNARFNDMKFNGGVGSFLLDFTGDLDHEASAEISVGLGSLKIVLPRDIGVRVESEENWLSSIDFSKRKLSRVEDDVYETENFRSAKGRLIIYLDVGIGSTDIVFE